jgi:hypothetical protein
MALGSETLAVREVGRQCSTIAGAKNNGALHNPIRETNRMIFA